MKAKPIVFDGSIAQNYDDLLGPILFEPFALELSGRINNEQALNVLELASGTGRVTKHLYAALHPESKLTATDINPGMIAVAKEKLNSEKIEWGIADISAMSFEDNQFDLVVCQFGIMFVPNKVAALKEIRRVLKPGGKLIFNTWGLIDDNKIWKITNRIVNSFLGEEPTTIFNEGPFCMANELVVLQQLGEAGFSEKNADVVTIVSEIQNVSLAAKGFLSGLPVLNVLKEKLSDTIGNVLETLESEFKLEMGFSPLKASLQAIVFTATK